MCVCVCVCVCVCYVSVPFKASLVVILLIHSHAFKDQYYNKLVTEREIEREREGHQDTLKVKYDECVPPPLL